MSSHLIEIIILASLGAGFISAIVGGSGIIILPLLLISGMPPQIALGTNKLFTTASLLTSASCYMRSGLFNPRYWVCIIIAAIAGSIFGVILTEIVSSDILEHYIPICIFLVGVYLLIPPIKRLQSQPTRHGTRPNSPLSIISSIMLGIYSGFVGTGTGSIWTLLATNIYKIDIAKANAMSRFMCFLTNVFALLVFVILQRVDYRLGLLCALCGIIGSYLGAKIMVNLNKKVLRYVIVTTTMLMSSLLIIRNLMA